MHCRVMFRISSFGPVIPISEIKEDCFILSYNIVYVSSEIEKVPRDIRRA